MPLFQRRKMDSPDPRFSLGSVLHKDDFTDTSLKNWVSELEGGGKVEARKGRLEIDVPKGATVWFRPKLSGPVLIEYQATVLQKGGPNDRVSDLNCFWMAQDPRHPDALLESRRSGKFTDYDSLILYYVGLGGNTNTTTRFRRYIGKPGDRPLRPEDDHQEPAYLLRPNVRQRVRLVASNRLIQYYRDDTKVFERIDPTPYTSGWFGLRTTANHMEIEQFRVYSLTNLRGEAAPS
jgi:hypothetical protein